jgi:hypothetical protein
MTTTLTDLNRLSPADPDATPWVATPDGSWTRRTGAGINPNIRRPQKEGRKDAPAENPSAQSDEAGSLASNCATGPGLPYAEAVRAR